MQTHPHPLWPLRITTFVLAALAAGSAAYWALKWSAAVPASQTAAVLIPTPPSVDPLAVARLLGGGQSGATSAALPAATSQFKLTGVVADRAQGGYALISIDGKPARPVRVGARVNDTLLLQSVTARSAALGASLDTPVTLTLELPRLNPP